MTAPTQQSDKIALGAKMSREFLGDELITKLRSNAVLLDDLKHAEAG